MEGVTTQLPVVPSGDYVVTVDDFDVKPSNASTPEKVKNLLIAKFKIQQAFTSEQGKDFGPGTYSVLNRFPMYPSDKNPDWDFRQNIGSMVKAALGIEEDSEIPDITGTLLQSLIGKRLVIKIAAVDGQNSDGTPNGRRQNDVQSFYPLQADEAKADVA